jgi:hypothetical protein
VARHRQLWRTISRRQFLAVDVVVLLGVPLEWAHRRTTILAQLSQVLPVRPLLERNVLGPVLVIGVAGPRNMVEQRLSCTLAIIPANTETEWMRHRTGVDMRPRLHSQSSGPQIASQAENESMGGTGGREPGRRISCPVAFARARAPWSTSG